MMKYYILLLMLLTIRIMAGEPLRFHGYEDCIKLENKSTRVVISGACGGRILEYSLNGRNIIYLDEKQAGWEFRSGQKIIDPCGGRFDIGPEYTIPKHPVLWLGKWNLEKTSNFTAVATSQKDSATGVQLIRRFELDSESSKLIVSQEIVNISQEIIRWCYWGRTLVVPDGICLVPLTPKSRFPNNYVMYQQNLVNIRPKDPNISVYQDFVVIKGLPAYPKLGFDSASGQLVYLAPNGLHLSMTYKVYPERVYNEVTAITSCIFYSDKFCELEPIGPQETLHPGRSSSFSVTWKLSDYHFPKNRNLSEQQITTILTNSLTKGNISQNTSCHQK